MSGDNDFPCWHPICGCEIKCKPNITNMESSDLKKHKDELVGSITEKLISIDNPTLAGAVINGVTEKLCYHYAQATTHAQVAYEVRKEHEEELKRALDEGRQIS